jgi:oxaloacetate decarboxylase gamma subunit
MDTGTLVVGVELMALGMGVVFGFLLVLVLSLRLMSRLSDSLSPPAVPGAEVQMPAPVLVSDHGRLVAVVSAAVARYRASRTA